MRVSYQWLQEYVDLNGISPEELAERLTLAGIEVEAIERLGQDIDKVVVGYVLEREKHPNADRLSVCRVDVGTDEVLQIVCGAPNVAAGQKVPVALIGARLPGGVKIKKSKLRGVESQGMICSAAELGIPDRLLRKDQTEGILVLPEEAEVGQSAVSFLGLDDVVLELALTPNRADCLSMIGVAYEVAAILDRPVKLPTVSLQETDRPIRFPVRVEAPDACWRYAGRVIRNVRIAPSPQWLQNRLMAAGMRPINNVVDITNYVMLEYGQPLHAFDADRIETGEIVVRKARPGERLVTLDDVERELDEEVLLITDGNQPIGLAGVMGGANSEVTDATTTIFLEAAKFAPVSVRRTAQKLGLRSEASHRFERGVAQQFLLPALERAAQLMVELAGGEPDAGHVEVVAVEEPPVQVDVRLSRINRLLGTALDAATVEDIWRRLGFTYTTWSDQEQRSTSGEPEIGWTIHVPSRRGDLTIEADLAEEVARLYGYDRIPTSMPEGVLTPGGLNREQRLRRQVRHWFVRRGWTEAITYSLTDDQSMAEVAPLHGTAHPIVLQMPMSEERSRLRTGLVPHLLDVAEYNRKRKIDSLAVFELGKTFHASQWPLKELPEERWALAGLCTGQWRQHWSGASEAVDFYFVKGVLEDLFAWLGLGDAVCFEPWPDVTGFHPGRTARCRIGDVTVGVVGQLHPTVSERHHLKEAYAFQLDFDALVRLAVAQEVNYRPVPTQPAVQRDLAIIVSETVPAAEVEAVIREAAGPWLERLSLFDVYRGQPLAAQEKSLAFSMVFRHPERTLTDDEVNAIHQQVVAALGERLGGRLR